MTDQHLALPHELQSRIDLLKKIETTNARLGCMAGVLFVILVFVGRYVSWLVAGIIAIMATVLLVMKVKKPPKDDLTIWGRRLIGLESQIPEDRSKAIDEIVETLKKPDSILLEIYPQLFQKFREWPSSTAYQSFVRLMKQDLELARRFENHPDPELQRVAGNILALSRPQEPIVQPAKTPETIEKRRGYSLVLVVAEESAFPLAEQLEYKLVKKIAESPRYQLAQDVKITTLHVPALPDENDTAAIQAFVWTYQDRYGKRGRAFQTEFQPTTLGVTFFVIYLE